MIATKQYLLSLFTQKKIVVGKNRDKLFEEFINEEENIIAVQQIQHNQKMMMDKWILKNKIRDIIEKQIIIPNATVGKVYEAFLDYTKLGMSDIVHVIFNGFEEVGLQYNHQTEIISGTPTQSGDFKIKMCFRVAGEADDSTLNEKQLSLVVNADPKSLWKDIPSTKTSDNFWKPDAANDFKPLGDKHIVVASKRGRSHANVGSFREDDFAFKHLDNTGWSIVCVADGAGSAKLSRLGSKIACEGIVDYFTESFTPEFLKEFDDILANHHNKVGEDTSKLISHFVYNTLSKAAVYTHRRLEEAATKNEKPLKDFHSTLIFALFKKYEFGYAILTFGVGDCPIGLLNKDMTELKLMNWLDVGEFGGGTRFITMPEIFNSDKFPSRFGFKLIPDFSYLMLMTDGIYDAKFVVEANLEKLEKWKEFLSDLNGENDDKATVEFNSENKEIANQLSQWMDFWSPGNHDDRTLAIVF
jgi:serine/threonine protein phosphatase PrpC